ncbi:MAG: type II secretion system F family protein [Pseudomonadales bacterium]|nr:type II secretion system F family protein [Pseudomonadales bacterium]
MMLWAMLAGLCSATFVFAVGRGARWQAARHETRLADLSARGLADLFLFVSPATLVKWSSLAFGSILLVVLLLTGSVLLAAPAALATWMLPPAVVRVLRRRRLRTIALQFPDGLDALAMALRSGLSITQAIAVVAEQQPAPLAQEFALVSRTQRVGLSLDEALANFTRRAPLDEIAMLIVTIRIARETGGTLAEALDRLAATVRRKLALEGKIRALTAQGRIQGIIVALLPPFLMLALLWLQPETMRLLFTTPVGWATLGAIGVLECIGYLLIRRIVRIEI